VRHHDSNFVIIRVNSFFHPTILRVAAAYSEAALNVQFRRMGLRRPRRNLSMRNSHCEGNKVENIDQASDVMVTHDPGSTRHSRGVAFDNLKNPLEPAPM